MTTPATGYKPVVSESDQNPSSERRKPTTVGGDDPTAADAVVATLVANGVTEVFALPGEENLPIVSALRRAEVPLIVCRHEQHAGFMAVANARLTDKPAVCLATLGPGALNLFTPLAQAQLMGVPLLALTGQKRLRDNDEGSFQMIDVVESARPMVALSTAVADPELAAVTVGDAWSAAITPPAGAVLVEFPEDVAAALVNGSSPVVVDRFPTVASNTAIRAAANRIAEARRPLLLVGRGGAEGEVPRGLAHLAESTGLSVLATQMGKGAIPETHPRSLRSLGIHRPDHAHLALNETDLVIAAGYRPSEHPPLAWQQGRNLPVIHLAAEPARREAGYQPELEIVGDLANTLGQLAEALTAANIKADTNWSDSSRSEIERLLADENGPDDVVDPLDVVRVLAERQRPGDVVALDNGVYKIWFARHYPSLESTSLVLDNATASMGAGLATATEAARLGHRATAVVGDGGLLMNVGDLETAFRLKVDLAVLVLRDDAYGFIGWHQDEQDRVLHGVDLGNPDLVMLAKAFGGQGRQVKSVDDLRSALDWAQSTAGLTLIDCPIDYRINDLL